MAIYRCNNCNTDFNDEVNLVDVLHKGEYKAAILCSNCGNFIGNGQCRNGEAFCRRCGEKVPIVYACPECWSTDFEITCENIDTNFLDLDDEDEELYDVDDEIDDVDEVLYNLDDDSNADNEYNNKVSIDNKVTSVDATIDAKLDT